MLVPLRAQQQKLSEAVAVAARPWVKVAVLQEAALTLLPTCSRPPSPFRSPVRERIASPSRPRN